MKTTQLELSEKTNNVLLDIGGHLPWATREPQKGNIINPTHLVIKGIKYTLVLDFTIESDSDKPWNDYYSSINNFYLFDADNFPIENANTELIRDWIVRNLLCKSMSDFKESKYKDFDDWKKNSPLVELDINDEVKTI